MTTRRIHFLLLVILLLSLLHSLPAEQDNFEDYEDVDLARCFDALRAADADGDGKLTTEEHLQFLQDFGPTEYWVEMEERPLELSAKFNAVACMCMKRGGDDRCCLGDNAAIDISGIDSRKENDYIKTICLLTQRAIDEVERQRFKAAEESVSVWLRAQFEVVVTQGDSQTEAEILQDLGQAMNMLVEEVLEEETGTARQRRLQDVEYLPTRLESTPIGKLFFKYALVCLRRFNTVLAHSFFISDCQSNLPSGNTCFQVDTITYVVGPQDQLDQAQLETALDDAIDSGELQELVDEVNPDSYLRVIDQEPVPPPPESTRPPTTAPPNEAEPEEPGSEDTGHDWSVGAITGLVLAGAGILALAAGLAYGRRRVEYKKEQDKFQRQASLQGSIINAELRDTALEHDLDDLEKGNGGGGMIGELSDVDENSRRLSYKMDQVGLEKYEDDALPAPPPASDPTFIILPFAGNRPQSSKEPSEGDLGASFNVHDDSHNSSSVFGLYDRKASSGSIGAKTPVSYRSAMGLEEGSEEDFESSDDDESSAYTSSSRSSDSDSSEITEGDTDSQGSSSSSGSSEYDEYGIMKARAYEARLAEVRSSMEARALEETVVSQDAPAESSGSIEMIGAGRAAAVASAGGASFYGATSDSDDKEQTVQVKTQTEAENNVAAVPASPSEGPNAGVIAGIAGGVAGAIALGGAAIYAATKSSDDDKDDDQSEDLEEDLPAGTETQTRDLDSTSREEQPVKTQYVENKIAAVPEEPDSLNAGAIAGITGAAVAVSGAAVYAAKRNNDEKEDDDDSKRHAVSHQDHDNSLQPPPPMETESEIDVNQQLVTLPGDRRRWSILVSFHSGPSCSRRGISFATP